MEDVLLEELIFAQLVKKVRAIYGVPKSTAVFTSVCLLISSEQNGSSSHPRTMLYILPNVFSHLP
jgi:hypothetical protein